MTFACWYCTVFKLLVPRYWLCIVIPHNPNRPNGLREYRSWTSGHTGWQYRYLVGPCGRLGSCCCSCCCCMRCCRPRALLMHFCSLASAAIVLLWVLALPSCMENLSLAIMQKNNKKGKERRAEEKKMQKRKRKSWVMRGRHADHFFVIETTK